MTHDIHDDHDVFVIDIDGRQSGPIAPLPQALREKLDRLRQEYFNAKSIKDDPSKSTKEKTEPK